MKGGRPLKKKKSHFSIFILVFLVMIVWTSWHMLDVGEAEDTIAVSVIVSDSNHDRWISLRQGLEQAAKDYRVRMNYVSTGKFGPGEGLALMERELENGASGLIVQMAASKGFKESAGQAAVILLESDVEPEDVYAYAGPDNYKMGEALAQAVKKDLAEISGERRSAGGRRQKVKLGILCGNQRQLSMQQRLAGFRKEMEGTQTETAWITADIASGSVPEEIPDLMAALGNDETEQLVDYLQEEEQGREQCLLYGIGCSEKAVYYLDQGIIDTLVVPNEFSMGYQSMEAVASQLRYHTAKAAGSITDFLVIDRNNLYDADNQKVLFPLVQ